MAQSATLKNPENTEIHIRSRGAENLRSQLKRENFVSIRSSLECLRYTITISVLMDSFSIPSIISNPQAPLTFRLDLPYENGLREGRSKSLNPCFPIDRCPLQTSICTSAGMIVVLIQMCMCANGNVGVGRAVGRVLFIRRG